MKLKFLVLFIILITGLTASAQDLVYQPTNPSFGGDSFNYQWLLSSAQTQNGFTDPSSNGRVQSTELERFTSSLNSQLLGQVTRQLFTDQFGNGGLEPGTYNFGSLALDIFPSNEGLVINILDTNTGEQTQIVIPN